MANTIEESFGMIHLSAIDADWVSGVLHLEDVTLIPGAASDELILHRNSITGPVIISLKSTDGEARVKYFNEKRAVLAMDFSECALSAGAIIVINHAQNRS